MLSTKNPISLEEAKKKYESCTDCFAENEDNYIVKYTIVAKADNTKAINAEVVDKIPEGLELDADSIKVSGSEGETTIDGNNVVVNYKELTESTITYNCKVTSFDKEKPLSFKNVVTLTSSNSDDEVSADATVTSECEKEVIEKIEKDKQDNKQQEKQEEKSSERTDAQTGDYVAIIMLTIFMISCLSLAVLHKKYGTKE